jgi:hypothetical protein
VKLFNRLRLAYGNNALKKSTVSEWHKTFKEGAGKRERR